MLQGTTVGTKQADFYIGLIFIHTDGRRTDRIVWRGRVATKNNVHLVDSNFADLMSIYMFDKKKQPN